MKENIKKLLLNNDLINQYYSGIGTILMLHRVYPFEDDKLPPNENLKVSPQFLEKFIIELKSKRYEFISLDRLHEILVNRVKVNKQIIFTLDDGYKDNYEIAYPIFKKHNVPFTIYVTTSFINRTSSLWWYVLEDLIVSNNEITISDGSSYSCKTENEKVETFIAIKDQIKNMFISSEQKEFAGKLEEMFSYYKHEIDWFGKCDELIMSWDNIQKISKDPLVTIGGHTKNHYALNKLSPDKIVDEIIGANSIIENKIGRKIEHFAYPFGSMTEIGRKECDIVKSLGYKTCTITRSGNIFPEHRNYLECLPRVMFTENFNIKDVGIVKRNKVVIA